MNITNGRPKTYADVLEEIFKNRELIKLKIMKEKEEELALEKKNSKSYQQMLKIAKESLLKNEKLSIPYLMRILKCSYPMAEKIITEATSDNDPYVEIEM